MSETTHLKGSETSDGPRLSPPGVRHAVRFLRSLHPDWTLEQISSEVHVTRERVRQLLVGSGLRVGAIKRTPCDTCGFPFNTVQANGRRRCESCRYHAKLAHRRYPVVVIHCEECGVEKVIRKPPPAHYRARGKSTGRKDRFCSKKCLGRWLGRERGITAENHEHRYAGITDAQAAAEATP